MRTQEARDVLALIHAFEVRPEGDEAFLASWRRVRAVLAARAGYRQGTLHRALRADVPFRFVDVAAVASAESWRDAVGVGATDVSPVPAHPGLYAAVREDRAPDGRGGVVLIIPFEVAPEDEERFLAGWDHAREALARQQGYLGTRLHWSVAPADFRFVEVIRWSSPLMFARARQRPEFREGAEALPFPSHPALYQSVEG